METSHQNHKIDQNIIMSEYVPMDFTKTSNLATKTPPHLLLLLALHLHYNICSLSSCNSVQIKQKKTNKPSGEGLSLNGKKETLGS